MRHLITPVLMVAAVTVAVIGMGPLFFGEPLLGYLLIAPLLVIEFKFWSRVRRPARQ